eukprot:155728-Alexandrium_andersonii.AAC.1
MGRLRCKSWKLKNVTPTEAGQIIDLGEDRPQPPGKTSPSSRASPSPSTSRTLANGTLTAQ